MKIYSTCQKCNEDITASTKYETRGEHAMRVGDFIEKRCRHCNNDNRIPIDDFKARSSKEIKLFARLLLIITLAISVVVFLWLLNQKDLLFIWYGMFGIPFLIYGSLLVYDRNRVTTFNRLFAKR